MGASIVVATRAVTCLTYVAQCTMHIALAVILTIERLAGQLDKQR